MQVIIPRFNSLQRDENKRGRAGKKILPLLRGCRSFKRGPEHSKEDGTDQYQVLKVLPS